MPIYEYKCSDCEAHVEKMQKVSDEPLKTCEVCGGNLEKQWSLSGIQFKGAGWYVTDYSNKLKDTSSDKSEKSEKSEKSDKSGKPDKSDKSEKTEKTSASESTAKTETASNKSKDNASNTKTNAVSKKD
ncbi:MAG: zinc ribbon domain-containing protein [Acidobacteria bacterium]|nr:zinc ribbon domain-containing protein [Acidobacteriota bacterium]MBA4124514.1 zinc ribbon domain-containing protein [Acidobacteriota bacterium]MBA4183305.1 zinc ribbon domain-containing protein [Acidobacteriota bacterium]